MRRVSLAVAATAVLTVTASGAASAQSGGDPSPFGHDCKRQNGVRFCPTRDLDGRVASFDDVPLDVDVTLPTRGRGPFPTIVMLHGYGGSKDDFESDDPAGDGSTTYHYNNNFYAKRGYAVITYSARGFGDSCGSEESREDEDCDDGYIHLGDQRYEARDTQHLLGLLVDEGIVDRRKMGVTGISYGGGQSIELALLRDRIRKPNDEFQAWRSPEGERLSIAAAYPRWPWSDLVASLLPNGQFLDDRVPREGDSRNPLGIAIITYVTGLYLLGQEEGYYCGDGPPGPTPCDDEDADITAWYERVLEGEPPDDEARDIADEIFAHHQGFGLPLNRAAPLLLQSGWTDDLFPARESLRMYNALRDLRGQADVALQFGDLGHARGSNQPDTNRPLNDQGADFFDELLQDKGSRPDPGSVTAFAQVCPNGDQDEGPFEADSWSEIHPRTISFSSDVTQTAVANPPDPLGPAYDPIAGGDPIADEGASCETSQDSALNDAGTAVYKGEPSDGFRMIGLPTVNAEISVTGSNTADGAQLDSRLWDVAEDGTQILVSRGAYRIETGTDGEVTFQLSGNAWCFAPGHTPKLQLLGTDRPYLRPTTGTDAAYSVNVESVEVKLPAQRGQCGD